MLKELGVPQIDGRPFAFCASGERYETLPSGGVKKEGEPLPALFTTAEGAWRAYNEELRTFVVANIQPGGCIVWRARPTCAEVEEEYYLRNISMHKEYTPIKFYSVWSRLVVTSKSQTEPSE